MATNQDVNINLNVNTTKSLSSLTDLKKQFREIQEAMSAAGKAGDTELFNKLKKQAASVKDSMGDLRSEMTAMSPDALIQNFANLGSAMIGAFSAGSAIATLFGADEKKLQEIQKNSLALIQLLQAAEVLRTTIVEKGTLKVIALKIKEAAAWALANPLMAAAIAASAALVAGGALLLSYLGKETEAVKKLRLQREASLEINKAATEIYAKEVIELETIAVTLSSTTASADEYKVALTALDTVLGTNLASEKDLNIARQKGLLIIESKIGLLKVEAKAEAAKAQYTKDYIAYEIAQQEYKAAVENHRIKTSEENRRKEVETYDLLNEALQKMNASEFLYDSNTSMVITATANRQKELEKLGISTTKVTKSTTTQTEAVVKLNEQEKIQVANNKALVKTNIAIIDSTNNIAELYKLQEYQMIKDATTFEEMQQAKSDILDAQYARQEMSYVDYLKAKDALTEENNKYEIEQEQAKYRAFGELMGASSQLFNGLQDMELANAEGNAAKQKQIKKKYAIANLLIGAAQSGANIAQAITATLATTGPIGFALIAPIIAQGIAAIGTIMSQVASIQNLKAGGYVSGAGTGTSDSIPARLSNGEFVVNAQSTRKYLPQLTAINNGYAGGGMAGGFDTMGLAQEIARAVGSIPVVVSERDITKVQRRVSVNESRGRI
mgnify:CR=1 FL=1